MILNRDNLHIQSIIVKGSLLEETLEDLGWVKNVDPLIPVEIINLDNITHKRVSVNKDKSDLEYIKGKWQQPTDVFLYSKIKHSKVYDDADELIGQVEDLMSHSDQTYTLIISGSIISQILQRIGLTQHSDLLIPSKFISSVEESQIRLNVTKSMLTQVKHLSLGNLVKKTKVNYEASFDDIKTRFHYGTYEVTIDKIKTELSKRSSKLKKNKADVQFISLDVENQDHLYDFVKVFNDVAMTSMDPYEEMSVESVINNFSKGSYILYRFNMVAGYCISAIENDDDKKIGIIAGIGIHPKHRGKGLSTTILDLVVDVFEKHKITHLQCDILMQNEASIGLFTGLGFEQFDDFYLAS